MPKQTQQNVYQTLTIREQTILRSVVHAFIQTADPIGSRTLAEQYQIGLSPASIRNTLSKLEALGYLGHPYTSAGRIPTQSGYRAYVDSLMKVQPLSTKEHGLLQKALASLSADANAAFETSSLLLAQLSNLLGVVLTPKLSKGVLHRLDVVILSSTRILFVISVRGGLVNTIIVEAESNLKPEELDRIVRLMNERLAGLSLEEIQRTSADRLRDLQDEKSGLVRLVLKKASVLFSEKPIGRRVHYAGTQHIVSQPEFIEPNALRDLINFLEDQQTVIHLLEYKVGEPDRETCTARVSIGTENLADEASDYSIVTSSYRIGETLGTIGVIGPTRMPYERVVVLVETMATLLEQNHRQLND